ncbi:MAG: hypothetical protein ISS19_13105 [Bacteroidales bacterium]|nr:hypothetical protein [Bacteroidales bacterium]
MRYCWYILFLFFLIPSVRGQQFEWQAGFDGFLDNREYYNSLQEPQTIFGSRFSLEIGGSINQEHRLRGGLNYMYEFGGPADAWKPSPVLYYQYDKKPFTFFMGAFPRKGIIDFPLALLTDTLNYYRPNVEGTYLDIKGDWGYQDVFLDWTSRQTDTEFERFMFGFSGRVNWNMLFFKHHFLMGHFARPRILPPDFHLRDNGGFDVAIGADLSEFTFLDTLWISMGSLVSLDRTRSVDDGFQTPAGFLLNAMVSWHGVGLYGTVYQGEGHTFLYGDAFYKAKQYGRLDMFWAPFKSEKVQGKIVFSLHFVEGITDTSQQILVSIRL